MIKKKTLSKIQSCLPSTGPLFEALESRWMNSGTPWNFNSVLIHQDQAAVDFPQITGAGEAVVVIDTGADPNHPAFAGKNLIFKDFFASNTTAIDTDGHGTGVAGILGGDPFTFSGDGTYGQGIAPGVQLIILRADSGATNAWAPQAARISTALDWVIANQSTYNIVGVNISLGSNQNFTDTALTGDRTLAIDQQLQGKFATLASAGIFVGSAAGNSGARVPNSIDYPAADANVYSIGSVNSAGAVSSFSSRGVLNDLLAPAENIIAPYEFPADPNLAGVYYINYANGTSFASPQLVGAAALIKQINPAFTPAQIIQILKDSGTPVRDSVTGNTFPLLNLDAALKLAVLRADPINNHTAATAVPLTFSNNVVQLSGLTSLSHTQDFYSFTLSTATSVTFQITATGGAAPTTSLLDVNGAILANVDSGPTLSLGAGTYYLLATGGNTTLAGSYAITLQQSVSTTTNHDAANATTIPLSNGQGQIAGGSLIAGLPDYYKFTVSQTSNVSVALAYGSGDSANATLLNTAGNNLADIPVGGTTQQLAAGTYYVLVASPTTLAHSYGVSVTASSIIIFPVDPIPSVPGENATNAKIAYDPYGRLHMAYYDGTAKNLKYAMRNADGTWSAVTTIDASPQAGTQLSIAIDPYGLPGIAYYDAGTGHLKYAHFSGAAWSITTADASGVTGWQPSLIYTNAAKPYIAYFAASTLDLRVASLNGSRWSIAAVDTKGNVGFVPSIAYDKATGVIGVAYQDLTKSWYKYASSTGGSWKIGVIDTTTHAAGGALSLAFDAAHLPEVTYNDAYNLNLMYARSNGSSWFVQQVNGSAHGMAANLGFANTGAADILYYNYFGGDIEHARLLNGIWSNTPITAGGSMLAEADSLQGRKTVSWITAGGVQIADV